MAPQGRDERSRRKAPIQVIYCPVVGLLATWDPKRQSRAEQTLLQYTAKYDRIVHSISAAAVGSIPWGQGTHPSPQCLGWTGCRALSPFRLAPPPASTWPMARFTLITVHGTVRTFFAPPPAPRRKRKGNVGVDQTKFSVALSSVTLAQYRFPDVRMM